MCCAPVFRFSDLLKPALYVTMIGLLAISALLPDIARARKVRNILVLHSYHQGLQWTDSISEGIQSELASGSDEIEIHYEYLDTKRNPGEQYYRRLVAFETVKTQLAKIDFELIISSDNNAMRFIIEYGDRLFPGVPVVFCGVNNFHTGMLEGKTNITGVVEDIDYAATLDLMRQLHPRRDRVLVILDRTPTGEAIKKEFDAVTAKMPHDFRFEYYQDFTLDEVPAKVSSLGPKDLIYILTFNRDKKNNFISYVDGIRMVRYATDVPIYGSWAFYFGNGIVGGMITSGFYQGQQAARIGKQILDGTPVALIPISRKSPNRYMFDYNEMKRFDIDSSQLPADSQVINLPPRLYERHKVVIIITMVILTCMALVLAWRLNVQQRRARILRENNIELDRRVAEQTQTLQTKNQLLESEIKERKRIEGELIDKATHLEEALSKVKILSGMLPICANCKKIRDDKGYWNQLESYIDKHSDATFSHGICPDCSRKLYPDIDLDL